MDGLNEELKPRDPRVNHVNADLSLLGAAWAEGDYWRAAQVAGRLQQQFKALSDEADAQHEAEAIAAGVPAATVRRMRRFG